MNSDPSLILRAPVITEESTIQTSAKNQYTFKVDPRANKNQIRDAVEKVFKVKVVSVNTMNYDGKTKRRGRLTGRRPNWKKAIVTLQPGQSIDMMG